MLPVLASIYTVFPFKQLIDVNDAILKFWHNSVGLSWGAAIIGLTVVIRLAILPLSFKQVRSMQELQRIQPQMKKLQQRYKEDKKRLNEEMMKLYQEHGVNPFGSCLPLVLQLPFFFSLYGLQRSNEFKHQVCPTISATTGHGACTASGGQQFFFIPNILEPLHGAPLVVMILLYVATMLGSSLVSATNIQDKNQRRMMFVLPVIFIPFVIRFPAGLLVYWVTTNVWTIGQQLLIKRLFPAPALAPAGAPAAVGKGDVAAPTADGRGKQGTWGNRLMKAIAGAANEASSAKDGKDGKAGGGKATAPAAKPAPKKAAAPAKGAAKQGKTSSAKGSSNGGGDGARAKPPPRSPRKRKKRSGRRR